MWSSFKFYKFYKASETLIAPASSILFLAIDQISRLGVPSFKAKLMVVDPTMPNPQLLIKRTFKDFA